MELLNPAAADPGFQAFQRLIYGRGVDTNLNMKYITSAKYLNVIDPVKIPVFTAMVDSANKLLPATRQILYDNLKDSLFHDDENVQADRDSLVRSFLGSENPNSVITSSVSTVDLLFGLTEEIADTLQSPPRETAIASAHASMEFYAHLRNKAENEETKKLTKMIYLYCLAAQAALLGIRTNGEVYARYPKAKPEILDRIRFLVVEKEGEVISDNGIFASLEGQKITAPEKVGEEEEDSFILIG